MTSEPQPLHTLRLPSSALVALSRKGVESVSDLSNFTRNEISDMNGVGRKALAALQSELRRRNLSFKETK